VGDNKCASPEPNDRDTTTNKTRTKILTYSKLSDFVSLPLLLTTCG